MELVILLISIACSSIGGYFVVRHFRLSIEKQAERILEHHAQRVAATEEFLQREIRGYHRMLDAKISALKAQIERRGIEPVEAERTCVMCDKKTTLFVSRDGVGTVCRNCDNQ